MCEVPDSPEPGTNQVVSAPPKTVTMKAVKQKSASKMHHHNLALPTAAQPVSLVHGTKEQRKAGVPNYTTKATLCRGPSPAVSRAPPFLFLSGGDHEPHSG